MDTYVPGPLMVLEDSQVRLALSLPYCLEEWLVSPSTREMYIVGAGQGSVLSTGLCMLI